MRAAAAAERLRRPSGTAMRRSGVMRGSEAPLTKGSSRAWDPDRAAREAGERASRSGLRPNANGSGKRCEHPEEAYADMRYRSADKVCPGECADRLGCKLTLLCPPAPAPAHVSFAVQFARAMSRPGQRSHNRRISDEVAHHSPASTPKRHTLTLATGTTTRFVQFAADGCRARSTAPRTSPAAPMLKSARPKPWTKCGVPALCRRARCRLSGAHAVLTRSGSSRVPTRADRVQRCSSVPHSGQWRTQNGTLSSSTS